MYRFLFFLVLFSSSVFSQNSLSLEKTGGFVIIESKSELSISDKQKIESANFDEYRFYTIRKKIQLVRGPLIELKSIKELEAEGKTFPKSIVDLAKSKSETFKHESILNLNLGLGIYSAYEPK